MTSPKPLTRQLAHIIASAEPPIAALRRARTAFIDTIGVMLAGLTHPSVLAIREALTGEPLNSPLNAARILGTAAHALDYDDVAFGGHPSAVLVPAILAAGSAIGATGTALPSAYAIGYEIWAELASREKTLYHVHGFHPTGLLGPIAAAAACARLLGLNASQASHALAIAASSSAGLMVNFGSLTKPQHVGNAAHAGLLAARLAQAGSTGAPDALEASNGFLVSFSPSGNIDTTSTLAYASSHWRLVTTFPSIKRYPVCYASHRAIEAALHLRTILPCPPEHLDSITVTLSERHSGILRYRHPETISQARFSLEFIVATALIRGNIGLQELTDETLHSLEIRALMGKIRRNTTTESDPDLDGFAPADWISAHDNLGNHYDSPHIKRASGHRDRPLDEQSLRIKFGECLATSGRHIQKDELYALLATLDTLEAVDWRQPFTAILPNAIWTGHQKNNSATRCH